ncbi:MAG: thioester reductase domain-containing protein [Myxococcales bacterium]|nr:thioester reductase domain-containing protein [Myxococcales bacterium]
MSAAAIHETLVALLRHRAATQPDAKAYTFLEDGEREAGTLTFAELDRRARAIAVQLLRVAAPGERALLLHPPGIDYVPAFFGCLYAGVVGVPAFPPSRRRHDARLRSIITDSEAKLALTVESQLSGRDDWEEHTPSLRGLQWIATDAVALDAAPQWSAPAIGGHSLAYLQYTSGSTSTPKGVMVSHRNLLYNLSDLDAPWEHDQRSVMVTWLPVFHDMGLIYGLLGPLYTGFHCVQMSPMAFIQRPVRWLRAITAYGGTHSAAPNFAFEHCVRKIRPTERAELDLHTMRMVLNAAEPIRVETMARFNEAFGPHGFPPAAFTPGYGLAESTLKVTAEHARKLPHIRHVSALMLEQNEIRELAPGAEDSRPVIGCGGPMLETKVAIVDPETHQRCSADRVGEIWVGGPSRAQGYWRRPEESAATFRAKIRDADGNEGDEPFLRTGDLGFMLDGQLFITGRLKDLIIVRGSNHYPQDIEWTVEHCHPALRPGGAAAFSMTARTLERVIVIAEVRREAIIDLDRDAVVEAIRRAVADEHEVAVDAIQLVEPGGVPKTSSGKKRRSSCRKAFLAGKQRLVGGWLSEVVRAELSDEPQTLPTAPTPASTTTPSPASEVYSHLEWLREYAERRIDTQAIDERRTIPPHIVLDLGNRGLLGMQIPREFGGLGFDTRGLLRVIEQLGAIDQTLALFVTLNNVLGVRPLLRHATPSVQAELLPRLAQGRELAAFALTEPNASSNPNTIESYAVPSPGGWRLHGTKWWSGAAAWAGVIHAFVQELDADGRSRGVSAFAIPQGAEGLRQGPESLTMGVRGLIQNTVHLGGAKVDESSRLGEPGRGMDVAQDAMMYGRLAIAAMSLGGLKRCSQLMLRYAERREVSTGRLLENPVTRTRLSKILAKTATIEALVYRIADRLDAGLSVPPELYAVAKIAGPEFFWAAADALLQLLGGRGYVENNHAPKLLRDARVLRIFQGPTESLAMYVGSRLWNRSEELTGFIEELGAKPLAGDLRRLVEELRRRWERESSSDPVGAARWFHLLLGDVGVAATLLAAILATSPSADECDVYALRWATRNLEEKIAQARAHDMIAGFSAATIEERVRGFRGSIGEVDCDPPGVDRRPDPYLGRHYTEPEPTAPPLSEGSTADAESDAVQDWIVRWLADELQLPEAAIDRRQPLSEIGLDSVMAASFIADLNDWLGTDLAVDLVWSYPTIEQLAARAVGTGASEVVVDPLADTSLPDDIRPAADILPAADVPKNILLTGATGYLGAYLLRELLDRTEGTITCLVRAPTAAAGRRRIREILATYDLDDEALAARIRALPGDLSHPRLGQTEAIWAELGAEIDTIYHCGALVNFAYPYQALRAANVLGTLDLLRLATTTRLKPLHHISTYSIVGSLSLDPRRDIESDAHIFRRPLFDDTYLCSKFVDLGYVKSKWVADHLILAARDRGVPVAIYRPASISGHSRTGRWSDHDWVVRLITGCVRMGVAPNQDVVLNIVPVDRVVQAIVNLSHRVESRGRGYNLANPRNLPWSTIVERLNANGFKVTEIDPETWQKRLVAEVTDRDHPLYPLVPVFARRDPERIVLGFSPRSLGPQLLASLTAEETGLADLVVDQPMIDRYLRVLFGAEAPGVDAGPPAAEAPPPPVEAFTEDDTQRRLERTDALYRRLAWHGRGELSRNALLRRAAYVRAQHGWSTDHPSYVGLLWATERLWERLCAWGGIATNETLSSQTWRSTTQVLIDRILRDGRAPSWLTGVLYVIFRSIDVDGDGLITPREHTQYLASIGVERGHPQAFHSVDVNGSGSVDMEEFEDSFIRFLSGRTLHDAGSLFLLGTLGDS